MNEEMQFRERKARLRNAALGARDRLDPVERIEMSIEACDHCGAWLDFQPGTIVSGFLPIRSEIDLRPLMDRLRARGARLCLPVVIDRQTIVFRELLREAELIRTGFGTVGPAADAAILDPDILLMPLAAFDASGNRIGYGAGHYDRAIARLLARGRRPRLVGMAFSVQEVDSVPCQSHDVALHAVVTEKGVRTFAN